MRYAERVELTPHSLIIDGLDLANITTGVHLTIHVDELPTITLKLIPDEIRFIGEANVIGHPHEGIDRIRAHAARIQARQILSDPAFYRPEIVLS